MSNYTTGQTDSLAQAFKALSNPKRLTVFLRILDACSADDCCCTADALGVSVDDLASQVGLAKSTISHHLKELRVSGLISMVRKGKYNEFRINWDFLTMAASLLGGSCGGISAPPAGLSGAEESK